MLFFREQILKLKRKIMKNKREIKKGSKIGAEDFQGKIPQKSDRIFLKSRDSHPENQNIEKHIPFLSNLLNASKKIICFRSCFR